MILGRVIVVSIDFSIEGITLMDEVWLKDGRKCSKCNQLATKAQNTQIETAIHLRKRKT